MSLQDRHNFPEIVAMATRRGNNFREVVPIKGGLSPARADQGRCAV
jgi:hypothetical protein